MKIIGIILLVGGILNIIGMLHLYFNEGNNDPFD